ncbi:hypothetical protein VSP77_17625, partial [Myroides odoratimimus]|uniref:hypothetical protein n=1 Tax=Myroides odoratimimus TaxID=76832 RepID=UPI002DBCC273
SVFLLLKKLTLLMRFTGISGILYRNKWYTLPELMVHFNGIVVQYGMEYPIVCRMDVMYVPDAVGKRFLIRNF